MTRTTTTSAIACARTQSGSHVGGSSVLGMRVRRIPLASCVHSTLALLCLVMSTLPAARSLSTAPPATYRVVDLNHVGQASNQVEAAQAEDCFYQAYQQCHAASLDVNQLTGMDTSTQLPLVCRQIAQTRVTLSRRLTGTSTRRGVLPRPRPVLGSVGKMVDCSSKDVGQVAMSRSLLQRPR